MENEQKSFEQQKSHLLDEFNMEKQKLYDELKLKDRNCEKQRNELIQQNQNLIEKTINDFQIQLKIQNEKQQNDIKLRQSQFENDFTIWKKEYENDLKIRQSQKENTLREQFRLDRDRQIDSIIAKVDVESLKNQQDYDIKFR